MSNDPFKNDAVRQALELSESPLQKAIRQMEADPATRALRELENSPAMQAARMLEQNDIQKLIDSVTRTHAAFDAFTKSQQWAEVSGAVAAAHSALARPETFEALQRITGVPCFRVVSWPLPYPWRPALGNPNSPCTALNPSLCRAHAGRGPQPSSAPARPEGCRTAPARGCRRHHSPAQCGPARAARSPGLSPRAGNGAVGVSEDVACLAGQRLLLPDLCCDHLARPA